MYSWLSPGFPLVALPGSGLSSFPGSYLSTLLGFGLNNSSRLLPRLDYTPRMLALMTSRSMAVADQADRRSGTAAGGGGFEKSIDATSTAEA